MAAEAVRPSARAVEAAYIQAVVEAVLRPLTPVAVGSPAHQLAEVANLAGASYHPPAVVAEGGLLAVVAAEDPLEEVVEDLVLVLH